MTQPDEILRRLKLSDIRVLIAVNETGGMGKAARRLNTVQPAVSRTVADVERMIGAALFERTPRGIVVTPHGEALVQCGKAALDELRQGLRHLEAISDPTAGEIRVAGNEPIIAGLIPVVLTRLRQRSPGTALHISHAASADQQQHQLRERLVDLVVARQPQTLPPDIDAEEIYREASYIVASAQNRWAKRRKIDITELLDEPWTLPPPGTVVASIFEDAFRKKGLRYPSRNVAFGHTHLSVTLVTTGDFLAILPGSMLKFSAERFGIKRLAVQSPVPAWPVAVMTLKRRTLPPIVQRFIALTREVARGVDSRG